MQSYAQLFESATRKLSAGNQSIHES